MSCINCNCPACNPRYYTGGVGNTRLDITRSTLLVSTELELKLRIDELLKQALQCTETIPLFGNHIDCGKPVVVRKTNVSPEKQAHIDHLKKLRKQRW